MPRRSRSGKPRRLKLRRWTGCSAPLLHGSPHRRRPPPPGQRRRRRPRQHWKSSRAPPKPRPFQRRRSPTTAAATSRRRAPATRSSRKIPRPISIRSRAPSRARSSAANPPRRIPFAARLLQAGDAEGGAEAVGAIERVAVFAVLRGVVGAGQEQPVALGALVLRPVLKQHLADL